MAFQVLESVAGGQYASDSLRAAARALTPRDAGLASQIVFGTLRFQGQLDYLIFHYSRRRVEALQPEIVIALRTALFQLRYLDRIPAHAAVHETVELVKKIKRPAAGLVNAVLRKVRRDTVTWPDRATELSCPDWLLRRWDRHFGRERADQIARAALAEPVPYLRVPVGTAPPEGYTLASTSVPGCFRVVSSDVAAGDPELGPTRWHDIGSQSVLPQLGLQQGNSYLDLCAAPGNKTLQALETPLSLAIACDISRKRLETVPPVCHRVVLDGTQPLPFNRQFDRIFVDAPCSGTGTCGRNPEIKWRVQESDLGIFAERQRQLLAMALAVVAPQGRVLYATCSMESEENEEVVSRTLADRPAFRLVSEKWRFPGDQTDGLSESGDGFYGALLARRDDR